jgi:hypothetical protein
MRRVLRRAKAEAQPPVALTVWQPWAAAIVQGPKDVENRSWAPPRGIWGHRVWIHAGKVFDGDAADFIKEHWPDRPERLTAGLPGRAIVGSAMVLGAVHKDGRVLGGVDSSARLSSWFVGPWGWVLTDRRALAEPIPCLGALGLWRLPAGVQSLLRGQG